jgi:hypothetical protein
LRLEALEGRWVPTTLTPTTFLDGGLGSGSLRDAVLQFNADTGTADDIIQLLPGTYSLTIQNFNGVHETAGRTGDLNLTRTSHRWIIQGAGPTTTIDASRLQDRVFQIVNPGTQVLFQDLVIQGGLAQDNGRDGAIAGFSDALGGGIFNNGGDITLEHVVLQNNTAREPPVPEFLGYNARGGGLYATSGSLTISESTIASNQAIGGNGSQGTALHMAGNGGDGQGGGLYAVGALVTLTDTTISTNTASGGNAGGGNEETGGYIGALAGNGGLGGGGQGGGLYTTGGTLTLTGATISMNVVSGGNGGNGGDGQTGAGGGGGAGGAGQGGGLFTGDMVTLTSSTISLNAVRGGNGGDGGGSFFNRGGDGGNGGGAFGGGFYNISIGTLQATNATIALNIASGSIGGAGGSGSHSGNPGTGQSGQGGGVGNAGGTVQALNTVFGRNTATSAPDFFGALGSLGHNLIGNSQGGSGFDPSDLLDTDPLLGPLQDNGGPTQSMALLPGSPALNAGDPSQLGTSDQRGVVRSGGVNIGAYQASATAFLVGAPAMVQSGLPFDVTVTAVDPFGQVAVGYAGTVTFSSSDSDPGVILPADYPFTLADGGSVTFPAGVTLITPGDQTLTVSDTADDTLSSSATVTVGSPAPGSNPSGLGPPPPNSSPASLAPAQPPPSSAPSEPELFAGDGWKASAPEENYGWAPAFRLRHQVGGQPEAWLADLGPPEDQRGAGA